MRGPKNSEDTVTPDTHVRESRDRENRMPGGTIRRSIILSSPARFGHPEDTTVETERR